MAENTCSQKGKKRKSASEYSWSKKSRDHASKWWPKLCVSLPRVKGGLECWFPLLWQVNMCTVTCDWSAALSLFWVFQQHNAARRDRHSTPEPILGTGDTQNVVRQHFSDISEPCLVYRESHWIPMPKYEQDLGKKLPLSIDRITVPLGIFGGKKKQLFIKATNSLKLACF